MIYGTRDRPVSRIFQTQKGSLRRSRTIASKDTAGKVFVRISEAAVRSHAGDEELESYNRHTFYLLQLNHLSIRYIF